MNSMFVIWLLFVLALSGLCLFRPNAARIVLGLFFILMAVAVNSVFAFLSPDIYVQMGGNSFVPLYRWFFNDIVSLSPAAFVLPVALYQIIIGLLMLGRNSRVRTGLAGGIAFLIFVAPFGLEELPNLILAAAMCFLLTRCYELSLRDYLHATRRSGVSPEVREGNAAPRRRI